MNNYENICCPYPDAAGLAIALPPAPFEELDLDARSLGCHKKAVSINLKLYNFLSFYQMISNSFETHVCMNVS